MGKFNVEDVQSMERQWFENKKKPNRFEDNNAKQTADFEEGRQKMYNKHGVISIFNLNEKNKEN